MSKQTRRSQYKRMSAYHKRISAYIRVAYATSADARRSRRRQAVNRIQFVMLVSKILQLSTTTSGGTSDGLGTDARLNNFVI